MGSFYLTLGLLLVMLGSSLGCTCARQHPQTQFCNSGFVVKAKVLARKTGNNQFDQEVKYIVDVLQDYKNSYRPVRGKMEIFTRESGISCGASFQLNQNYIISGSISRGVWLTTSCDFNRQVTSLTNYQRQALRNGTYKQNCGCEIVDCSFVEECPAASQKRCVISSNNQCYYNSNACTRSRRGCGWDTRDCGQSNKAYTQG